MRREFDRRVAIVTGGASGLGAATAKALHREGATVVIADIAHGPAKDLAEELGERAWALSLDVTDEAQWDQLRDTVTSELGGIDVLVNNAGIGELAALVDTPTAMWHRIVAVNQTGVFLGLRAVLPVMTAAGKGAVVNIASIEGTRGAPMTGAYAATKHAVIGLTRTAALEVASFGVRVNTVCPGMMATAMLAGADVSAMGDPAAIIASIPAGRPADPAEVAELVVFLASDRASYCNGGEFVADGAWATGYM